MKVKPDLILYKVWLVQVIIIFALMISPVIILLLLGVPDAILFNAIYSSIIALIFIFILAWMKYYILSLEYEVGTDSLILKGGVWWKQTRTIPYHKITDVKLLQGPVERYWGVSSIAIQTAGQGQSNLPEGKLNGLRDSEKIRSEILKHVKKVK
jgi:membrane protein YdbS with pleckstrin-like domain